MLLRASKRASRYAASSSSAFVSQVNEARLGGAFAASSANAGSGSCKAWSCPCRCRPRRSRARREWGARASTGALAPRDDGPGGAEGTWRVQRPPEALGRQGTLRPPRTTGPLAAAYMGVGQSIWLSRARQIQKYQVLI
jgi:hypothetical protein